MVAQTAIVLTLLGVIIGVAVVTGVATVIEGANVYVREKIATLGSGVFQTPESKSYRIRDFQKFLEAMRKNPDLKMDDLEALRESVTLARRSEPGGGSKIIKYGSITLENIGVQGCYSEMIALSNVEVAQGRYISEYDDTNRRFVCFVGTDVVKGLFPDSIPWTRP